MEIKEETLEELNTVWLPQEPEEPWPLFIVPLKALGRLAVGQREAVAEGMGVGGREGSQSDQPQGAQSFSQVRE